MRLGKRFIDRIRPLSALKPTGFLLGPLPYARMNFCADWPEKIFRAPVASVLNSYFSMPIAATSIHEPSNGGLIRRLFGLAWRYRLHCLQVLGIQLVLLSLGIGGLSFTGLGIDYIRHKIEHTPAVAAS